MRLGKQFQSLCRHIKFIGFPISKIRLDSLLRTYLDTLHFFFLNLKKILFPKNANHHPFQNDQ